MIPLADAVLDPGNASSLLLLMVSDLDYECCALMSYYNVAMANRLKRAATG